MGGPQGAGVAHRGYPDQYAHARTYTGQGENVARKGNAKPAENEQTGAPEAVATARQEAPDPWLAALNKSPIGQYWAGLKWLQTFCSQGGIEAINHEHKLIQEAVKQWTGAGKKPNPEYWPPRTTLRETLLALRDTTDVLLSYQRLFDRLRWLKEKKCTSCGGNLATGDRSYCRKCRKNSSAKRKHWQRITEKSGTKTPELPRRWTLYDPEAAEERKP